MFLRRKRWWINLRKVNFNTDVEYEQDEDKKFKMREESFLSNKVCYPIIEGLIDGQDNYTNLIISFKLSKSDKIALHLFLLIVICLSIIMCFLSHDILVLVVVLSWGIIMSIVFLAFYIKNCKKENKRLLA